MQVAIIDYGSGNLRSAVKAFERSAREAGIAADIILTDKAETVAKSDRVVLPGVGAYADCKAGLAAVEGMVEALNEAVIAKARHDPDRVLDVSWDPETRKLFEVNIKLVVANQRGVLQKIDTSAVPMSTIRS